MSSRAIRKIQKSKEPPLGDDLTSLSEDDSYPGGGARRKSPSDNKYNLLSQLSPSESNVEEKDTDSGENQNDQVECDQQETTTKLKKKKKKKKTKKSKPRSQQDSEDNFADDEINRSIRIVNRILGVPKEEPIIPPPPKVEEPENLLRVRIRNLNPHNELIRMFGAKVVREEIMSRKRYKSRHGFSRNNIVMLPKIVWDLGNFHTGLSMSRVRQEGPIQYYVYGHSISYQEQQKRFMAIVDNIPPSEVVLFTSLNPNIIDAMIESSDLCKQMIDSNKSAIALIEKALYFLENGAHPCFSFITGNFRLEYTYQQNRSIYVVLYKNMGFLSDKALHRTALEMCKMAYTFDLTDPLAMKLIIDFYAIRSREFAWFIKLYKQWDSVNNLSYLPNMAYSIALANYHVALIEKTSLDEADNYIQKALISFPSILMPMLKEGGARPSERLQDHDFFTMHAIQTCNRALGMLCSLYVGRSSCAWREQGVLKWLEKNALVVLDRVDAEDPLVKESERFRKTLYPYPPPMPILRHVFLSGIHDATKALPEHTLTRSWDPYPPSDGVELYRKEDLLSIDFANNSAMLAFIQSIGPMFDL